MRVAAGGPATVVGPPGEVVVAVCDSLPSESPPSPVAGDAAGVEAAPSVGGSLDARGITPGSGATIPKM